MTVVPTWCIISIPRISRTIVLLFVTSNPEKNSQIPVSSEAQAARDQGQTVSLVLDLPPYMNYTERRLHLEIQWGFKCQCSLCTSSPSARRESDRRLHRIQQIIEGLNIPPAERKPNPILLEELITLHEKEGLWGPIAGAQMYAAMEYENIGNRKKAREWAGIAKESLRMWSGVGHEYYAAMKRILGEDVEEKPYTRLLGKANG